MFTLPDLIYCTPAACVPTTAIASISTFASRGPEDSNLKRIEVTMPHSEFLAQEHIKQICTRQQFAADTCPPGSIYGHAVAYTPLFDEDADAAFMQAGPPRVLKRALGARTPAPQTVGLPAQQPGDASEGSSVADGAFRLRPGGTSVLGLRLEGSVSWVCPCSEE